MRLREALPDAVVEDGAAAVDPWVRVAPGASDEAPEGPEGVSVAAHAVPPSILQALKRMNGRAARIRMIRPTLRYLFLFWVDMGFSDRFRLLHALVPFGVKEPDFPEIRPLGSDEQQGPFELRHAHESFGAALELGGVPFFLATQRIRHGFQFMNRR